MNADFLEKDS